MQNDNPSFTEILSWWPSDAAIASDFGLATKSRATKWRERNSMQPKYWPVLISKVAERFGKVLTAEQLMLSAAGKHRPIPSRKRYEGDNAEAA